MFFLGILLAAMLLLGGCESPLAAIPSYGENAETLRVTDNRTEQNPESEEENVPAYNDNFICIFPRVSVHSAYQSLSSAQKLWYDDVEHILGSMATEGMLSGKGVEEGLTEEDLELVFQCVCMDHPEFFYVEGFSYVTHLRGDEVIGYAFSGNYGMEPSEAERKERELTEVAMRIRDDFQATQQDQSDYQKVKYVYEYLIKETEYDLEAPDNQNIYSALIGKRSVCQGYSKAMQFLLHFLGVESTLVQGTAFGQPHGWNLVFLDGDGYYVDVTWGDNSYHAGDGGAAPEILYDYLLVTTEEIQKEHQITRIVPLPDCTGTKDNYFVRENAYFTEANAERLKALFQGATAENGWQVSLKCSDKACFDAVKALLLDQNQIFDYYPMANTRISYYQNEELFCLTFWVTN